MLLYMQNIILSLNDTLYKKCVESYSSNMKENKWIQCK